MYKKEYEQVIESKDENWWKKTWLQKNVKDFNYQVDKVNKVNKAHKENKSEDKADKTYQELPLWTESKDEFNKLRNCILTVKDNEKTTIATKCIYHFGCMKELIKDIANNKNIIQ